MAFPPNPYPNPYPHTPLAHRVWILDCRSCDAFLTNRAMKAVLLLRPNVSLFSSDAMPVGCSPYSASPDSARPTASQKNSRTCECLTQNLCCHTCGTAVGYKIVLPCTRCTSSIGASNRATNGHRFVFHSTEVVGTERHYIQDEPGVVPYDPPYLPTPPLEFAVPQYANDPPTQYTRYYPHRPLYYAPPSPSDYRSSRSDSPPPPLSSPLDFYPADQKDSEPPHQPPSLQPGDVICWHHLARKGEVPGVVDDLRARHPVTAKASKDFFFNR